MQRVAVVGTSGSGKSVLAQRLAQQIDALYVDLDSLYWQADWQGAPPDIFHARVMAALQHERWVVAGNYSKVRDLIWSNADTLVWLDYQLLLIMWRLLRRTIKRIVSKEDLWGTGNRETWRKQFFDRESLFLWALQSRPRQRREYPQLFQQPEYHHLHVVHLHSPHETEKWVKSLTNT